MAVSYKEYLDRVRGQQLRENEGIEEELDTAKLTKEVYERKKRKKKNRPFSQETLLRRLNQRKQ